MGGDPQRSQVNCMSTPGDSGVLILPAFRSDTTRRAETAPSRVFMAKQEHEWVSEKARRGPWQSSPDSGPNRLRWTPSADSRVAKLRAEDRKCLGVQSRAQQQNSPHVQASALIPIICTPSSLSWGA